MKATKPSISSASSRAPGAQAHAPALEAASQGKNVKRLKCKSGHRPANTEPEVAARARGRDAAAIRYPPVRRIAEPAAAT